MKKLKPFIQSYRITKFEIDSNIEAKILIRKMRIRLIPLFLLLIFVTSMFGLYNIFFFLQVAFEYIVAYLALSSLFYLVITNYETAKDWQKHSTRIEINKGKILHSLKEGALLLFISMIIFGLIHITGLARRVEQSLFDITEGTESPLKYIPTTIEAILLAMNILLILFSIFASINWLYARGLKIIGYHQEKKLIKIDYRRLIYWLINLIVWCMVFPFVTGILFIDTKFPDLSQRLSFLTEFFSDKPYLILVFVLISLLLLNAFYLVDGTIANKKRKNFVEFDLLDAFYEEQI